MTTTNFETHAVPVPTGNPAGAMKLSDFMNLEEYELPATWSWLDNTFADVEAAYRDRGVDLLRVGPSDVGSLIDEMAGVVKDREYGWHEELTDLTEYRRRVAAFECEILRSMEPNRDKVADMPLLKLARLSDAFNGLPFATRRRAATDVSDRLGHELDKMKIAHEDATLEAEARLDFLTAVHRSLGAELLSGDGALADHL